MRKRSSPGVTWTKSPDRETTMSNNNFTDTFKMIIGKKVKVFDNLAEGEDFEIFDDESKKMKLRKIIRTCFYNLEGREPTTNG